MKISEKNLRLMCEELMDKLWGDKLEIPVVISSRMTNSLGLFYSSMVYKNGKRVRQPLKIAISKSLLEYYSLENIEGVIKHELCHYHLYKKGGNYCDGDKEFEDELKRIGSHSTCTLSRAGMIYTVKCSCCGKVVRKTPSKGVVTRCINTRISVCCEADLVKGEMIMVNDNNKQDCNYKSDNNISVIHKYVVDSSLNKSNKITKVANKVSNINIDEVVVPGPRGVTCKQVYWAMRALTDERSESAKEKIRLIAQTYPQMFEKECRTFPKKRMAFINFALS